jgi:HEAT repeat protein
VDEAGRGNAAAAVRLADLGGSEPDGRVREQAVAALGRIKDPLAEPALTVALGDVEAAVRARAVRGLRGIGTDTAIASLAAASIGDADPEVRLAAVNALMSFPGHTMTQGLVRAAADPDGRVRDAAARALAWWGSVRRSGAP